MDLIVVDTIYSTIVYVKDVTIEPNITATKYNNEIILGLLSQPLKHNGWSFHVFFYFDQQTHS